jgi:hypothetical protein
MKTICMGRQGMSFFNPNSTRRTSLLDLKVPVGPFRVGTARHENKGLKHDRHEEKWSGLARYKCSGRASNLDMMVDIVRHD